MPQSNVERLGQKAQNQVKRKAKRKVKSKARKTAKKIHPLSYVIWVLVLLLGIGTGILGGMFLCRDDCFEIRGKNVRVALGAEFAWEDPGARVVEYGKDISDQVKVQTDLIENEDGTYTADTSIPGTYFIKYTVDSPKYGEICRIRTITVGGAQ